MFSKRDGTQIAKVETEIGKPYGPEFVIADSEEIIGIYGYKGNDYYEQLGFIVWTPPRLWLVSANFLYLNYECFNNLINNQ